MRNEIVDGLSGKYRSIFIDSAARDFIRTNKRAWEEFHDSFGDTEGRIAIDATINQPNYLLPNLITGMYIGSETGLSPSYFVRCSRFNRRLREICRSYAPGKIFHVEPSLLESGRRDNTKREAERVAEGIDSGTELLDLKYHGVKVGDLVYDTYLRQTGNGTVDEIDGAVLEYIQDMVYFTRYCDNLVEEEGVRAALVSHDQYMPNGILARVVASRGGTAFIKVGGANGFTVRRYEGEIAEHRSRPSEELFEYVFNNHRERAISEADTYMQDRMNADTDIMGPGATTAYSEYEVVDREWLTEQFDVDPENPNVVVMSHIFIDAVHHGDRFLFDDYMCWLRETLDHVVGVDSANWLVKPHPHNNDFEGKNSSQEVVQDATEGVADHTVVDLPRDINPRSLLDFADVILTAKGSAGLEFSCFGIPAIIAGETSYSGFGFTIEPKSKAMYFEILNNVDGIESLSREETDYARVLSYIQYILMKTTSNLLPRFPPSNVFDDDQMIEEATKKIRSCSPNEDQLNDQIRRFISEGRKHLLADDVMAAKSLDRER